MKTQAKNLLIIGASRGLGYAMAEEFVSKNWNVIGTVRDNNKPSLLHDLANRYPDQVRIETLDITSQEQIHTLHERLAGQRLDMLYCNAGTTTQDQMIAIGKVSTEEFNQVMLTNVLGPMRVLEAFEDLVLTNGLIGVMSSGQGSISNNQKGMREVYRASKAALNMLVKSFAVREQNTARSIVLMAPGWIRTGLGGDQAPFTLEETVPDIVNVLLAQIHKPGLKYLDRFGNSVPW